jgi:hypothetical protein
MSHESHMKESEIYTQYSSYGRGTVRRGYFDESKIGVSARSVLLDSPHCTERENGGGKGGRGGEKGEEKEKKERGEERFLFKDSDRRTGENNVPRPLRQMS